MKSAFPAPSIMFVATVFALLTSCGPSGPFSPQGTVNVTMDAPDKALSDLVFTSMKVQQNVVKEGYDGWLLTGVPKTGTQDPDLAVIKNLGQFRDAVNLKRFQNLESFWGRLTAPPHFYKGLGDLAQTQGHYFVPTSVYWFGIYYKPALFTKLGLKVPTTWDEFKKLCSQLAEKKITPIALGSAFGYPAALWFSFIDVRLNGPDAYLDLLKGNRAYTENSVLASLKILEELRNTSFFDPKSSEKVWQDSVLDVVNEKAGLVLSGSFAADKIPLLQETAFFSVPMMTNGSGARGELAVASGFALLNKAPNPEGALALVDAYAQRTEKAESADTFRLPAATDKVPTSPYKKSGADLLLKADKLVPPLENLSGGQFAYDAQKIFAEFFKKGSKETAKELSDKLQAAFVQTKKAP